MTDGRTPEVPEVIRAQRFEVVDRRGVVRAVVGDAYPGPKRTPMFGFSIHDPKGRLRACLIIDEAGPVLVFDLEGNNAIALGVSDGTGESDSLGPFCYVNDATGDPVFSWGVDEHGTALKIARPRP